MQDVSDMPHSLRGSPLGQSRNESRPYNSDPNFSVDIIAHSLEDHRESSFVTAQDDIIDNNAVAGTSASSDENIRGNICNEAANNRFPAGGDSSFEENETDPDYLPSGVARRPRIPRQVTFGVVAVQTDFAPSFERSDLVNGNGLVFDTSSINPSPRSNQSESARSNPALLSTLDSTFFCYLLCGGLLMFVGVGISVLITGERKQQIVSESNAAQLWIVGPIFLCSGILVCIKAGTHVFKRLHPQRPQRVALGNFLVPDSRASLARPPSIPPSYSRALVARVPSTVEVLEDENKPDSRSNAGDTESFALVTINFDPPPPSYAEAMDYRKRQIDKLNPRERSKSDASHLPRGQARTSDHSAQFPSPPISRSVSQANPPLEDLNE